MRKRSVRKRIMTTLLSFVMSFSLVFAPFFNAGSRVANAETWNPATEKPILVVTGTGIVGGTPTESDLTEGIAHEKAYTEAELQAMKDENYYTYSVVNSVGTKSVYKARGVLLTDLFSGTAFTSDKYNDYTVTALAPDYSATFGTGFGAERYYFPNFAATAAYNLATVPIDPDSTEAVSVEPDNAAAALPKGEASLEADDAETPVSVEVGNTEDVSAELEDNEAVSEEPAETGVAETVLFELASAEPIVRATAGDEKIAVPSILALELASERAPAVPEDEEVKADDSTPRLIVGQLDSADVNNSMFNSRVQKIVVGEALPTALTVVGKEYSRADLLLMDRVPVTEYSYSSSSGDKTEYAQGVPLLQLLAGYEDAAEVEFIAADGYPTPKVTIADLKDSEKKYILAYANGDSESNVRAIYDTAKSDANIHGYLTVYAQGQSPLKMITEIKVTTSGGIDFSGSPFKHINNGGLSGSAPYDIAAITGATLTLEGPGLKDTKPVSIRQLEQENRGAFRGDYTDDRGEFTYEGIKLSHLLYNMDESAGAGIVLIETAAKVQIKNRVRQTIAEFTLEQIKEADEAGKPIIVAYGVSNGEETAPFVYDLSAGEVEGLYNNDGCIKLVYDKSVFTEDVNTSYITFGNMAYIYVEEDYSPGYKHDKPPYDTAENSQYVVAITGDKIGREVNYTVEQLEAMVAYDETGRPTANGMGHRDEYSLANSNYWYVNEYEGVKLWDLLKKADVNQTDLTAPVRFTATDGYVDFDTFTLEQVSNPDYFGYYEKSPDDNDDGRYVSDPELDLRRTGFPVLVSYGVNNYPYVIKTSLEGYKSGLGNDGGPVRIISGKTEYAHANGSKQAKLLDKIIVGEDKDYSTHSDNDTNANYAALAENAVAVQVVDTEGNTINLEKDSYTVADIENLIYGQVTNQQKQEAKVKDFYSLDGVSDLYEGVNFRYFLEEVVEIPGVKGNVEFYTSGDPSSPSLTLTLEELYALGSNAQSKKENLPSLLAFAKNGYPLVANDGDSGYVDSYTDGFDESVNVKNDGGPLAFLTPEVDEKSYFAQQVTAIKINLQPDNYAHMKEPYNAWADSTITIDGEGTRLDAAKEFTVAQLEGKQRLALTGDYTLKSPDGGTEQIRYRGIELYKWLQSTDVGLRANASELVVENGDGKIITIPLADAIRSDYLNDGRMILAYGSAAVDNGDPEDGKPLVKETTDQGYDATYHNSGGPLRLVVGQKNAEDNNAERILDNVVSITVNASDVEAFNHSISPIYQQYLNEEYTFRVIDGATNSILLENTYTLEQIEAMTNLIVSDDYTYVGTHAEEGIDLWKFVKQEVAASGIGIDVSNPSQVNVKAGDGTSRDLMTMGGLAVLENGIEDGEERKIIILSYSVDGKPLVPDSSSDGYDSANEGGPLRLIVHNNQGACLKDTRTIEVVVSGGSVTPTTADFALSGEVAKEFTVAQLTANTAATGKDYQWFDKSINEVVTDKVTGVPLADLLSQNGISGDGYTVSLLTADNYNDGGAYLEIPLADMAAQEYFVAYAVDDESIADAVKGTEQVTTIRIYRNLQAGTDDQPSDWRNRITNIVGVEVVKTQEPFTFYAANGQTLPFGGIRAIVPDSLGGVWVGTYGAGAAYIDADGQITHYNTTGSPALKSDFVVDIALDSRGGVWLAQCGSYDGSGSAPDQGVAYLYDGNLIYYQHDPEDSNSIPHNYVQEVKVDRDGNVWLGSFGGITKYTPGTGAFRTWTKDDGLPATSVDNFTFDNKGGVWIGTYPDSRDSDGVTEFSGGYAYLNAAGEITTYMVPQEGEELNSLYLADFWVREIAIDSKGGAYIVRSGSYGNLPNEGGRVDYVAPDGTITHYTGKELISDLAEKATQAFNPEIRTIAIDGKGNFWIGTSGLGVYTGSAIDDLTANYSSANNSWPTVAANDNIYVLNCSTTGDVYVGSSGGVAVRNFGAAPPQEEEILQVSGPGTDNPKGFTLSDLQQATDGVKSLTYSTLNNFGTVGTKDITGIAVPYLLDELIGLNDRAESVTFYADDGYNRTFRLDDQGAYGIDKDGNPLLLAWLEDGKSVGLRLVIGQTSAEHVNLPNWVSNVAKIVVNSGGTGTEEAGLLELNLTGGSLAPSFNKNTTAYILPVAAGTESVQLTLQTLADGSRIKVNSEALAENSKTISLTADRTRLIIEVSVDVIDKTQTKTYVVDIYKKAADITNAEEPIDGTDVDVPIVVDTVVGDVQVTTEYDGTEAVILPLIDLSVWDNDAEKVNLYVPAGTKVTPDDPAWDGNITMPTIMPNSSVTINNATVNLVINLGDDSTVLRFDNPVRLKFNGLAGKKVGYRNPGSTAVTTVDNLLPEDSAAALTASGESSGYLNVGNDLIVWTTYTADYVVYTAVPTGGSSSSGGGGSGSKATTDATDTVEIVDGILDVGDLVTISTENGRQVYKLNAEVAEIINDSDEVINTIALNIGTEQDFVVELSAAVLASLKAYSHDLVLQVSGDSNGLCLPLNQLAQELSAGSSLRLELGMNEAADFSAWLNSWQELVSGVYAVRIVAVNGAEQTEIAALPDYLQVQVPLTVVHAYSQMGGMQENESRTGLKPLPTTFARDGQAGFATIYTYTAGNIAVVKAIRTFADLSGHWAQSDINTMANKSLVNGKTDTSFYADDEITRAEFVAIVNRAMAYSAGSLRTWPDVSASAWYAQDMATAFAQGLLLGDENGMRPEDPITRAEIAVIMQRVAGEALATAAELEVLADYADSAAIPTWAESSLAWTVQNNLMRGDEQSRLNVDDNATRAEGTVLIMRLLEKQNMFSR